MAIKNGRLITIEGVDGSGKSTVAKALAQKIREASECSVLLTCEPTKEGIFSKILRDRDESERNPLEEYWLYQLDRADHNRRVIMPAINKGMTIVSDRSFVSTLVYQGASGKDELTYQFIEESMLKLNDSTKICRMPDVIFFLDISLKTLIPRINSRGNGERDRYESNKQLASHREGYRLISKLLSNHEGFSGNVININAEASAEDVLDSMFQHLVQSQMIPD